MEQENKKKVLVFVLVTVILLTITIVLSLITNNGKKADKLLLAEDYIIKRETSYSKEKGLIPIINLKGEKITEINNEIISKYYSVVSNDIDEFKYEYYTYKGILSLLITVTYYNDSEYGNIEYYSYNIKVDENKVLSNKELYNYLNIDSEDVTKILDKKMDSYFKKDTLNQELSFDEYKEIIGYEDKNNKLIIKDNKLYCYHSFKITQSLIDYKGNVNEIKIKDLAK